MSHFQRIGLLASLEVPEVVESLHKLESFLKAQGREVIYEQQAASLVDWAPDNTLPIEAFSERVDLGIVVGRWQYARRLPTNGRLWYPTVGN